MLLSVTQNELQITKDKIEAENAAVMTEVDNVMTRLTASDTKELTLKVEIAAQNTAERAEDQTGC